MNIPAEKIDALLPQTQCQQCGYAGCAPYAAALAAGTAPINLCPPGGDDTVKALADLLQQPIIPLARPARLPQLAVIDEEHCIGCTKCIQACPVDAILGAAKQMHAILPDQCTGCELCIEPCPMDCITLIPAPILPFAEKQQRQAAARQHFMARTQRLAQAEMAKTTQLARLAPSVTSQSLQEKQAFIQAAIARAKEKRIQKRS